MARRRIDRFGRNFESKTRRNRRQFAVHHKRKKGPRAGRRQRRSSQRRFTFHRQHRGIHQRRQRGHTRGTIKATLCHFHDTLVFQSVSNHRLQRVRPNAKLRSIHRDSPRGSNSNNSRLRMGGNFHTGAPRLFNVAGAHSARRRHKSRGQRGGRFSRVSRSVAHQERRVSSRPITTITVMIRMTSRRGTRRRDGRGLPNRTRFCAFRRGGFLGKTPFPIRGHRGIACYRNVGYITLIYEFFWHL